MPAPERAVSLVRPYPLLREQRLEGAAPACAQRGDAKRALELTAGTTRQVQQRIDFGDRHALGAHPNLDDFIPGFDLAFLENTEIESGPAALDQQRGHPRLVQAYAHAGSK